MPTLNYPGSHARFNLAFTFLIAVFFIGCGGKGYNSTTPPPSAVPTLASITPTSATQGETKAVTLTGTNFASGATVNVDGAGITVSNVNYVSSTAINATFTLATNATTGSHNVTVSSGGTTTSAVSFTVNAIGPPTLATLSPASGIQGQNVSVTLTGTNFISGGTVTVSGTGVSVINVAVVDATHVTATFAIAPNATLGDRNVTVATTAGTSAILKFTVTALQPAAVSSFPSNISSPVPTNSLIIVKFNKPMEPLSARNSITVMSGTTPIAPFEFPIYDDKNHTVTFIPAVPLPPSSPHHGKNLK